MLLRPIVLGSLIPNMNSVSLKTNELLTYHYGFHVNNLATIAIMPIVPRKDQAKYEINIS